MVAPPPGASNATTRSAAMRTSPTVEKASVAAGAEAHFMRWKAAEGTMERRWWASSRERAALMPRGGSSSLYEKVGCGALR